MDYYRRPISRLVISLWAALAGAMISHAQSTTCAFNLTEPKAITDQNGIIQWLSDLDRIGPDRFRTINAVHNLDTHTRSIYWPVARLRVKQLLPNTTAILCRDDDFGDWPQKFHGELWFGNTGADVAQTTVLRGEYGPQEVSTLETGQPIKVIAASFVLADQPKLVSNPTSPVVSLSFQTDISVDGSRKQIIFEVRNNAREPVRVWFPSADEMAKQLNLGSGAELRPEDFRKAGASTDADLLFVDLPVVIYSSKTGSEAVIYIPTVAPSLRKP